MDGYAANIGNGLANLAENVVTVVIEVVIFLVIMGIGWLVATWLRKWLTRLLRRIGFDRAVERGGLHRLVGNASASDLTARLVVLAFLLFVLQLAFGIFGPNPVSDLIGAVIAWLPLLFAAVVIIVVAAAVSGWVKDLIANALGGLSYGRTVATAAQVLILVLGVMAALNQIGVATSITLPILIAALATVGGVIVVGVGGGLIRPMQHRWERILIRGETESRLAAEKVRAHRAEQATPRSVDHDTRTDDTRTDVTQNDVAGTEDTTVTDTTVTDTTVTDTTTADDTNTDSRSAGNRNTGNRKGETRNVGARNTDRTDADTKGAEARNAETRNAETRNAETRNAQTRKADSDTGRGGTGTDSGNSDSSDTGTGGAGTKAPDRAEPG